ncbi:Fe(3+) ABC transporter substrate-binding protein [Salirhabdus salicampi]|uniref:Fe(3+) ABC transporter substrate-binding protein n=1 Tax=Salirhabdus salicampi TaxID=476102 RepID=UPI0020C50964|nr:Fe(3+) ABC transporter substrate-binding protein [Salirhabdus salicampi]MCP8615865.1 Fe(3+) ABC transporter substrate-binding protein [Salirhabdus salicampi]
MKQKLASIPLLLMALIGVIFITGCASNESGAEEDQEVVNLYTSRHYDIDDELFEQFKDETGITVNVIKGKSDQLIERITREGEATEADLFFTADAGRLHRAKEAGLLQSINSDQLSENIPAKLTDEDKQWFGLTKRARVIVYAKDRVDPTELSTYENLTDEKWNDKVLIRSSSNIYNQSLLASFIELHGIEEAKLWAKGMVNNMAREPQGGDRDQAKAIAAGEGDVAVMNTYYLGHMLNSTDGEEVNVAKELGIIFPNQETTGTHVNVSGIGVTKHAKNKENAIKLIEFLSTQSVQEQFASVNYEYPVNPDATAGELLQSWGDFKEQDLNLSILGENNAEAVKVFNEVNWK